MAKLKSIDEERYNAIKAIDDELDELNGKTKAEEEARKKKQEQEKLLDLQNAINHAESPEERERGRL